MTKEEFIKSNGYIEQKINEDYVSKSIGSQYSVADAICELIDNAIDNRICDKTNIIITKNDIDHTFSIKDFGLGIFDPYKLFVLGSSEKGLTIADGKIGKYGIGLKGATSAIARICRYKSGAPVLINIKSVNGGNGFSMNVGYFPNESSMSDDFCWGEPKSFSSETNETYTEITFSNVDFTIVRNIVKQGKVIGNSTVWKSDVLDNIKEIYAETFLTFSHTIGLNINFIDNNNKVDFGTIEPTFDEENPLDRNNKLCVCGHDVWYRSTYKEPNERTTHDSDDVAIRIYDLNTGRLLGKSKNYWQYFADYKVHTSLAGLHVGLYIDSSIACYFAMGIKSTKNGINPYEYHTLSGYEELKNYLRSMGLYARKENARCREEKKKMNTMNTIVYEDTKYTINVLSAENIVSNKLDYKEVAEAKKNKVFFVKGKKCFMPKKYFKDSNIRNLVKLALVNNIKYA